MPALPPEATTTPAAGSGRRRMRLNMPRALKLPPTLQVFELQPHLGQSSPSAAPGSRHSGVCAAHAAGGLAHAPAMRAAAAWMEVRIDLGNGCHGASIVAAYSGPMTAETNAVRRRPGLGAAPGALQHRQPPPSPTSRADRVHRRPPAHLGVPLRLSTTTSGRKANLFATLGEGKPGGVILSGHTDTVPWDGQAWTSTRWAPTCATAACTAAAAPT
jgi:hypothetical protein